MSKQEKWDRRYLELAELVSSWSKDPSTKVGAVIVDVNNKIVSMGFNGLPQYVPDDPEVLNNRDKKYQHIIHAEMNAILTAQRDLNGYTIYTYPFAPCPQCASAIIQTGIVRVVSVECKDSRWIEKLEQAKSFFDMADVETKLY